MDRSLKLPLAALAVWIAVSALGQWLFFRDTLQALDARAGKVGLHALAPLMEHAHRVRDDLILQEAVKGVAQAPGIMFAGVVDRERRALAHSQPALLGQRLTISSSSNLKIWTASLKDAANVPWGTLAIGVSRRVLNGKLVQQSGISFFQIAMGFAWMLWIIRRWAAWRGQMRSALERLEFERRELEQKYSRERQSHETQKILCTRRLQSALQHVPRAVSLLDDSQRWVADNRLDGIFLKELLGRSWQDNPILSGLGDALQRSLEHPGARVTAPGVEFLTETTQGRSWTWIFWNSN